ncbi:asparagine-tRNA ligase [Batrachochytrium salamandrivorans]|nr:asparagine-tRNA ligase [Batrachochytrium salamandrivorans]
MRRRLTTVREFISQPRPEAEMKISGWVRSVRMHKTVSFVSLYDGTTQQVLQVVLPTDTVKPLTLLGLNTGASVVCTGKQSTSKHGLVDMTSDNITLLGPALGFPVQKKDHSSEFLRDEALQFRHRTAWMSSILRVRSQLGSKLRQGLEAEGFEWISTPIITSNDCEGAGELFQLKPNKILPQDTYLTVSGQLHSEIFVSGGFPKVYTFGPTFRAENSQTTRHLCEFWMCEPEMAFATWRDASELCERVIKHTVRSVLETRSEEIDLLNPHHTHATWLDKPFAYMTFAEAVRVLESSKALGPISSFEGGLSTAQERFLVEQYCQNTPLFVTQFPAKCKPFYCLQDEDTGLADNFDLLVPGIGELAGGSAREHRHDLLQARMQALGLLPELDWYLDLRKYGTTPHAGFGVGFERLVQFVTGVENIRDVSPIPRFPGHVRF